LVFFLKNKEISIYGKGETMENNNMDIDIKEEMKATIKTLEKANSEYVKRVNKKPKQQATAQTIIKRV
jgi:hypothetical protein